MTYLLTYDTHKKTTTCDTYKQAYVMYKSYKHVQLYLVDIFRETWSVQERMWSDRLLLLTIEISRRV